MALEITKKDGSVETTRKGCVIETGWESVRVMSDVWEYIEYVVMYNPESRTFERRYLGSGYGETHDEVHSAKVDATEEMKGLYERHQAVLAAKRALAEAETALEDAITNVHTPALGKTLKVVRGRKIPKGTIADCMSYSQGRNFGYGGGPGPMRVGVRMLDGTTVYTDASNVEVMVGV